MISQRTTPGKHDKMVYMFAHILEKSQLLHLLKFSFSGRAKELISQVVTHTLCWASEMFNNEL